MTQVDFYIMGDRAKGDRYQLACRIAEKALSQSRRIYLHTNSAAESQRLDRLMWTYKEDGFLPHSLLGKGDQSLNLIVIGNGATPGDEHDVLINLANEVPDFFSRFERVAELIDRDPGVRSAGRDRFRLYRDRGYTLNTHNIEK
ncbi:MAG: DNA polymerase III subunit chi [Sedimenticola sp.]